jgi:hypothetical protein
MADPEVDPNAPTIPPPASDPPYRQTLPTLPDPSETPTYIPPPPPPFEPVKPKKASLLPEKM